MTHRRHHNNTGQAQVRAGKTRKQVRDIARILELERRVEELERSLVIKDLAQSSIIRSAEEMRADCATERAARQAAERERDEALQALSELRWGIRNNASQTLHREIQRQVNEEMAALARATDAAKETP